MLTFSLSQIAGLLQARLKGDGDAKVWTLCKIEAGEQGGISFLANPKYNHFLYETKATAVLVAENFVPDKAVSTNLLYVKDPQVAFTQLLRIAEAAMTQKKAGIHPSAVVAASASIGQNVYIGALVVVGENAQIADSVQLHPHCHIGDGVKVGENTRLYANVSVYQGCEIGKNCIIHAGTVIGSDGFGFLPQADGSYQKVPQLGNVHIGDSVEIGSNCSIDRATMGSTKIGNGVKLDNLIQVAHNVEIGANTVIAAQTGVAGSTKIGECCVIGGQVGIVGHIQLADGTKIGAQSGIAKSVEEKNTNWKGSPAQEYRKQLKTEVLWRKLEEMYERITKLEKKA